jgi:diguanylate cyclase (GGDEF)-like protein
MDKSLQWPQLSLRVKLMLVNALVVGALVWLSMQAWRASAVLENSQVRLVELADALHQNKQADMIHDALHADVLASLLIGQVAGLTQAELQQRVAANARAIDAALAAVARQSLPPELAQRVARNRAAANKYGAAATAIVGDVVDRRFSAMQALPDFETRFKELLAALDEQGSQIESTIAASRAEAAAEGEAARRSLLWTCGSTIAFVFMVVALGTEALRRRLRALGEVARAIAGGDLARRVGPQGRDELGELGRAIDRMADGLSGMIDTMRVDSLRATFGKHLSEALDMADREQQVAVVAARAMADISVSHPMELLVSDSSKAQMERAAEHPVAGAPGCGVGSPYDCVAVRRGNMVTFEHSDKLNACSHLRDRPCGPVSAVCVPLTFMGRAIGVLHASAPVDAPLDTDQAQQLGTLGAQIGMRIGTVRAFEKTQIQASTDSLTGLPNRRTLEQRARSLVTGTAPFAVVMCDLDHFKRLNDTHGHAVGDSALRTFADVLRHSLRESDSVGRWGGEEFAFVLANADAQAAQQLVDRIRARLVTAVQMGKVPKFTASFGVADSTMSRRMDQLVQMADMALYQAKASGRDRACIADPSVQLDATPTRHAEMAGRGLDVEAAVSETA